MPLRHRLQARRHPTADDVRRELSAWWRTTHGDEPEFAHAAVAAAAPPPDASRSTTSAAGRPTPLRCRRRGCSATLHSLLRQPHISLPRRAVLRRHGRRRPRAAPLRDALARQGDGRGVLGAAAARALVAEGTAAGTCGVDGRRLDDHRRVLGPRHGSNSAVVRAAGGARAHDRRERKHGALARRRAPQPRLPTRRSVRGVDGGRHRRRGEECERACSPGCTSVAR